MSPFPHHLKRFSGTAPLCEALARYLDVQLNQWLAVEAVGRRPLGLATGRTMEPLYAALVQRLKQWPDPDLQRLRSIWCSFNLDEYLGLPAHDPGSYRSYMQHHLGDPLQLPSNALQLPECSADADAEHSADLYAEALQRHGGIGLQLLGLGSNGHVGFNEPPAAADCECHAVTLSAATRLQNAAMFGGDPSAVPNRAITLGLAEILRSEEIHLVVTGASKAEILHRLLALSRPEPSLPASWLLNHPNVWLWADAAALA